MSPFTRDTEKLSRQLFDVVVIGGGIYGAGIAWDLALRGLTVALIEKNDFGGATSSGCFKLIHGGLRYLQFFEFSKLRESVEEQRILRFIAPHLVRPLPFLVPCYGFGKKGKGYLRIGMSLYELLAGGRNRALPESHHVLPHRVLSKSQCLAIAPGISQTGLQGGVMFWDAQLTNCERFTFSVVASAALAGAHVANYVEAERIEKATTDTQITSVFVRDRVSGKDLRVQGKFVINATGPWVFDFLRHAQLSKTQSEETAAIEFPTPKFSKGFQLVLPQIIKDVALTIESTSSKRDALLSMGGRKLFIVPWRGHSLLGTTDSLYDGSAEDYFVREDEIEEFLFEFRQSYASLLFERRNVQHVFGGLRLIRTTRNEKKPGDVADTDILRNDVVIDHRPSQWNMLSVVGMKYTTFRSVAEQVSNTVCEALAIRGKESQTARTLLYGAENKILAKPDRVTLEQWSYLTSNYGAKAVDILKIPQTGIPQTGIAGSGMTESDVLVQELLFVVRNEQITHLEDVVLRRTPLGTLGLPKKEVLEQVGNVVGGELGWSSGRIREEIMQVVSKSYYLEADVSAAKVLRK